MTPCSFSFRQMNIIFVNSVVHLPICTFKSKVCWFCFDALKDFQLAHFSQDKHTFIHLHSILIICQFVVRQYVQIEMYEMNQLNEAISHIRSWSCFIIKEIQCKQQTLTCFHLFQFISSMSIWTCFNNNHGQIRQWNYIH